MIKDFVPDRLHHFKRRKRRYRVHQDVTMDSNKMLGVQDAVLVLSGRIDNLSQVVLSLKPDILAEGVLDGRVVAVDKVAVHKPDRE